MIEREFHAEVLERFRRTCVRRGPLRFVCRVSWREVSQDRFRGTIELARAGTALNGIDRYALRIHGVEALCRRRCRAVYRRAGQLITPVRRARFGEPLELQAHHTTLRVTPVALVDPAPAPPFQDPVAGARYVGVQVVITNTGRDRYGDRLLTSAALVTVDRRALTPQIVVEPPCDGDVVVPAGETRVVCALVEVPFGTVLHAFELTPDSVNGPETGQWLL